MGPARRRKCLPTKPVLSYLSQLIKILNTEETISLCIVYYTCTCPIQVVGPTWQKDPMSVCQLDCNHSLGLGHQRWEKYVNLIIISDNELNFQTRLDLLYVSLQFDNSVWSTTETTLKKYIFSSFNNIWPLRDFLYIWPLFYSFAGILHNRNSMAEGEKPPMENLEFSFSFVYICMHISSVFLLKSLNSKEETL